MPRKPLISRLDWCQQSGVVLENGLWENNLPLTNVLDYRPQRFAESNGTGDSSTQFKVDLGAAREVSIFFFAYLRVISTANIRIVAGNTSDFSINIYDSGTISAWPWDITTAAVYREAEYIALGRPRFIIPSSPITVRYIIVQVTGNAVTTMQLGCFGACEAWESPNEFAPAPQITMIDGSLISTVPYGTTYIVPRGIRRRHNFGFPALTTTQMLGKSLNILLAKGKTEPIIIVPFPDNTNDLERTSVYGLVSHDNVISNPFFGHYAQPIQVDQLI